MKLWRRLVSVLAGTMFAASGVLGAAALLEVSQSASPLGPAGPAPAPSLDITTARGATEGDAHVFADWAVATASVGAPTHEERLTAAVGTNGLAELRGMMSPAGRAQDALGATYDSDANRSSDPALEIVADAASTPADAYTSTPEAAYAWATPVTLAFDSIASADTAQVDAFRGRIVAVAPTLVDTPRSTTDGVTAGEPTDVVARKAATTDIPAPVANWSASAEAAVLERYQGGALEQDILNLSLASQALRDTNAAAADALNAELRYRQNLDGSFGSIRETAEAARALAQGSSPDRDASVRALDWLDKQGTLAPDMAVLRLRAHAFDANLVAARGDATGAPPAPPASTASGGSFFGSSSPLASGSSAMPGKAALALWLLVGGIGLSLSLVTVDALKGARQRLYDTIRASPGLHVNELRRRLHMSPSSIEYHLAVLVGAGLVVAEDDGRYKRYYANGAGLGLNPRSPNSRNTLGALRRPHAVTLVRALAERPQGATARELSRALAIHESAAARRLSHLEKAGMLVSERNGRARVFRVRDLQAASKALTAVQEAPPVVAATPVPVAAGTPAPPQQVGAAFRSH